MHTLKALLGLILMFALLLSTHIPAFVQAQDGTTVTATTHGDLNIRAEPNANAALAGVLSANTTVEVLEQFTNTAGELWLCIPYEDGKAWIAGWLVTINGDIGTIPVWGEGTTPEQIPGDLSVHFWATCDLLAFTAVNFMEYDVPLMLEVEINGDATRYPFDLTNSGVLGVHLNDEIVPPVTWALKQGETTLLTGEAAYDCPHVSPPEVEVKLSSTCDSVQVSVVTPNTVEKRDQFMLFGAWYDGQAITTGTLVNENEIALDYDYIAPSVEFSWLLISEFGLSTGTYHPDCDRPAPSGWRTILPTEEFEIMLDDENSEHHSVSTPAPAATPDPNVPAPQVQTDRLTLTPTETASFVATGIPSTPQPSEAIEPPIYTLIHQIEFVVNCNAETLEVTYHIERTEDETADEFIVLGLEDMQTQPISELDVEGFATQIQTADETPRSIAISVQNQEANGFEYYWEMPPTFPEQFSSYLISGAQRLDVIVDTGIGEDVLVGYIIPGCTLE